MSPDLSHHAQERLQQRAIPPLVITLLHEYGSATRCGGAERLTFDKAARRRLVREFGGQRGLQVIERWLRVYAVISDDGHVITVAYRTRRFRRH